MSRATLILGPETREKAIKWVRNLPDGDIVEFRKAKRSNAQNARLWACLTDVATQVEWHGQKLSAEDWKLIFLAGLKAEMRMVPNLANDAFVNLGRSSSTLTKEEMSDLFQVIEMFGALRNVQFHDARQAA